VRLEFNSGGTANAGNGGLDLATFLLGDVTHFNRFVSTSLNAAEAAKAVVSSMAGHLAHDSKLTFNYGLRWEIYFPENR